MAYKPGPSLPLGSVIATFPHLTGAYACTATTVPDSNGFVLCQGQTLASGPMAGQVVPNISNLVFLRGNTTSSGTITSNSTSVTLAAGNIPQVSTSYTPAGSVSISHTHSASNVTGSILASSSLDHSHSVTGSTSVADAPTNNQFFSNASNSQFVASGFQAQANAAARDHSHSISGTANTGVNLSHGHSFSLSADGQSFSGSASLTGTLATITVGTASPSSFSIVPTYINAVYLMRAN